MSVPTIADLKQALSQINRPAKPPKVILFHSRTQMNCALLAWEAKEGVLYEVFPSVRSIDLKISPVVESDKMIAVYDNKIVACDLINGTQKTLMGSPFFNPFKPIIFER